MDLAPPTPTRAHTDAHPHTWAHARAPVNSGTPEVVVSGDSSRDWKYRLNPESTKVFLGAGLMVSFGGHHGWVMERSELSMSGGFITSYHGPLPGCSPYVRDGSAAQVCQRALEHSAPMSAITASRYAKKAAQVLVQFLKKCFTVLFAACCDSLKTAPDLISVPGRSMRDTVAEPSRRTPTWRFGLARWSKRLLKAVSSRSLATMPANCLPWRKRSWTTRWRPWCSSARTQVGCKWFWSWQTTRVSLLPRFVWGCH